MRGGSQKAAARGGQRSRCRSLTEAAHIAQVAKVVGPNQAQQHIVVLLALELVDGGHLQESQQSQQSLTKRKQNQACHCNDHRAGKHCKIGPNMHNRPLRAFGTQKAPLQDDQTRDAGHNAAQRHRAEALFGRCKSLGRRSCAQGSPAAACTGTQTPGTPPRPGSANQQEMCEGARWTACVWLAPPCNRTW